MVTPVRFVRDFDAARLVADHPPRPTHPNKVVALRIANAGVHSGTIRYARHPGVALPPLMPATSRTTIVAHATLFDYVPTPGAIDWHLNFANADLFCMYGAPVLAQDELQILEHPALASLREALLPEHRDALRTVEDDEPTPITILGVQRRCELRGLYGRAFARASTEEVEAALVRIDPPAPSNILAIEAPSGGSGPYSRATIEFVLRTAWSGFRAARHESQLADDAARTMIHTGFWGCGAYGGNRVLMTLLQLLAAALADVDLTFHAVDEPGLATFRESERVLRELSPSPGLLGRLLGRPAPGRATEAVIAEITRRGFRWGASDGN